MSINQFIERYRDLLKTVACLLAGTLIGVTGTLSYPVVFIGQGQMVAETPTIIAVRPTPTYGYEPKVEATIELVRSWCEAGDGTANPCDINHFRQLKGAVLYTTTKDSSEFFSIHKNYPGIMVVRIYRGGGFTGYPYWDIVTPSVALWSGETLLFTDYLQLDQQGRIVTPELPVGTQP